MFATRFQVRRSLQKTVSAVTSSQTRHRTSSVIEADAVIVGAGVIGSSIACELSRKGWKTVNVDKMPTAGAGSTGYSSSIIRTYYSVVDSCKLAWEGYHYFKNWEEHIGVHDDAGIATLTMCGSLIPEGPFSANFLAVTLPSLDKVGVPYEFWTMDKVKQEYGWNWDDAFGPPKRIDDLTFGETNVANNFTGAYFFPDCGYMNDPGLTARNLMTAAKAEGAEFLFNRQVVDFVHAADGKIGGVVLDDNTTVVAPVVVNAAGPHSSSITDLVFRGSTIKNDMTLSTRALRQEVAYIDLPPKTKFPGHILMDLDTGVYLRPDIGHKCLVGGLESACDDLEWVDDPDNYNDSLTDMHTTHMYRHALRNPELEVTQSTKGIVSLYDVTEDWSPIYDASSIPGYYMAIGTSGNQFKNAGVAGAFMAELIETTQAKGGAGRDSTDLQFKLKYTGGTINGAMFSRKRRLNQSSKSVLG
eukprot:m.29459 g.29459  ORF g.29459 m.29459 type:complete len:471 (+) comp16097_c0_seq2:190-1602(+)